MTVSDVPRWRAELQPALDLRRERGLMRRRLVRQGSCQPSMLIDGQCVTSFCSNDYLGLSNHPRVIQAFHAGVREYGVGSGASHMVNGHCHVHDQLEEELAAFTGRDRTLLFSRGTWRIWALSTPSRMGNRLSCRTSLIMHRCWMADGGWRMADGGWRMADGGWRMADGGWLSRAVSRRYAHGDLSAQEQALQEADHSPCLIVTDGVFSMDGDVAPLSGLIRLAHQHGAGLMVDDALGMGCLGLHGQGVIANHSNDHLISQHDIPVLIGTFGKAFGTAGAFAAGDRALIDYLEQFARTYTFTTALPPALAQAIRTSLALMTEEPWRRERLTMLISQFRSAMLSLKLPLLPSATPVQALILGESARAVAASEFLLSRGIYVSAIRPPTVPAASARLRLTLSAAHTDEQLERLVDAMAELAHTFLHSDKENCYVTG